MKHVNHFLTFFLFFALGTQAQTGRVGVGTTTPRAGLDVSHADGIVSTGTFDQGSTDNLPTGAGTRLLWIPRKAAFRAGHVDGTRWDISSVGNYSVALGHNTQASGQYSTALGSQTTASEHYSTALGRNTTANAFNATAMGAGTTASGNYSMALGTNVSTNAQQGSFIIGDFSTTNTTNSTASNQFTARFAGGYRLFTNSAATVGVQVGAGDNSWSTLSDSTRKENFRSADGAAFLRKISQLRLGSWNYRGQDPKTFRHYGPMAQDFFAAFGRDELGTIGEPTAINQADFDGVNLIAIQALIREVEQLKAENRRLQEQNRTLRADVDWIKNQLNASTGK